MKNNTRIPRGQAPNRYTNPTGKAMPAPVAELAAKLNAGGSSRCPVCLSWVDRNKVGSLAIYIPKSNPDKLIAYCVCRRCMRKAMEAGDPVGLAEKAEKYLDGGDE